MTGSEPGPEPHFLAIVGATASGKTALSLDVGRALDGEVVSMDSRQVYRGMDVGTGKVSLAERALIPHYGLDILDPDQRYSAGQFARDARRWIGDIRGRGRVPLLVGGTGFFLKALTQPLFVEPELDQGRLEGLRGVLNRLPTDTLRRWVGVLDPGKPVEGEGEGGAHRLTRRIEMALLTGRPLSWWHQEDVPDEEPLEGLVVVLEHPREALYDRINLRVDRMVNAGLAAEVKGLLEAGFGPHDPGMTGAGYREIIAYLRGETTLEEATELIRRSHRRYARRQMTWYRHQLPEGAVTLDGTLDHDSQVRRVCALWAERDRASA